MRRRVSLKLSISPILPLQSKAVALKTMHACSTLCTIRCLNIVWKEELDTVSVVFPRRKHRPDCYSKEGDEQYLISPGALDMGGLLILPRQTDFERIDERLLMEVMKEVVLPTEAMEVVTKKIRNKGI